MIHTRKMNGLLMFVRSRERDRKIEGGRQTDGRRERQIDGYVDRQAYRQTGRQAGWQTD